MKPKPNYTFAPPIESVDELAEIAARHPTLYDRFNRNSDGTPMRWCVNGQLKRWKRNPNHIRLPLAHGRTDHDAIESLDQFNQNLATAYWTNPTCAICKTNDHPASSLQPAMCIECVHRTLQGQM
jgi:hypothetical protein